MSAFSSPSPNLYQKKASCVFCNQIDEFVCGNASDTVFLFKDASVWLLHLCKTSALQNRIPKRSVHYWGESMGILLLAWTAGSIWRSTWMPMQNNVVNQSFFALPTPPSRPQEVYNGEPAFYEFYRERQLLSHKPGCGHFQLFAISAFKTHLESHLVLLSEGRKNSFWFPPSVYRREILKIPTWFLTSEGDLFNEGTVTNWFVPG